MLVVTDTQRDWQASPSVEAGDSFEELKNPQEVDEDPFPDASFDLMHGVGLV